MYDIKVVGKVLKERICGAYCLSSAITKAEQHICTCLENVEVEILNTVNGESSTIDSSDIRTSVYQLVSDNLLSSSKYCELILNALSIETINKIFLELQNEVQ